jgi:hypothetical protein
MGDYYEDADDGYVDDDSEEVGLPALPPMTSLDPAMILIQQGWLWKKGSGAGLVQRRNWKRRFFRLDYPNGVLQYYIARDSEEVRGEIKLERRGVKDIVGFKKHSNPNVRFPFELTTEDFEDRTYSLSADRADEQRAWMSTLLYVAQQASLWRNLHTVGHFGPSAVDPMAMSPGGGMGAPPGMGGGMSPLSPGGGMVSSPGMGGDGMGMLSPMGPGPLSPARMGNPYAHAGPYSETRVTLMPPVGAYGMYGGAPRPMGQPMWGGRGGGGGGGFRHPGGYMVSE